MSENKQDTRSASQKITDLENGLMSLYQTADNMARDLTNLKDALKLLGNKVDSIVKATLTGEQPTDDVISRIMIENNVEELKNKLRVMVAQGVLVPSEEVADDSFVVGQDIDDQGQVVNPRIQFALYAIKPEELQAKFKGAKVSDVLSLQEGKLKFKVTEIYKIQPPQAPDAPAAPSEAVPTASASEVPTTLAPETSAASEVVSADQASS